MSLKNVLAYIATLVILFFGAAVLSAETEKLNINTATEAELAAPKNYPISSVRISITWFL